MIVDSISHLKKHLERFHHLMLTNTINDMTNDKKIKELRSFKSFQENSKMKFGKMVMVHESSFSIVDKYEFRNFVSSLQP